MERLIYDRMRSVEADHWWFAARRRIIERQILGLKLPADAQILEVGCGTGGNLGMLSGLGHLRAIEPDDEARAHAAGSGVEVVSGFLPDRLPTFDTAFDLVAAFDVIEHVDDDAGAVMALAGLLKPGGRIIATVPAHQWMWSAHDELHHHKRRYARTQFTGLFEAAGLRLRKASYFNSVLFPVVSAVRLAKRLTGSRAADDDAMPSPLVNGALKAVFGAEAGLLQVMNLPTGVSILVIAERPA